MDCCRLVVHVASSITKVAILYVIRILSSFFLHISINIMLFVGIILRHIMRNQTMHTNVCF